MAIKADALVPEEFTELKIELADDKNYCAIIAVSAITSQPVEKVRELMEANGRKRKRGTKHETTRKVLEILGYKVTEWSFAKRHQIIQQYPEPHNRLENITTHHPRRFPQVWQGQPDMLMFSRAHVSAYVDGVVCDWAVKHSKRVVELWLVEKA